MEARKKGENRKHSKGKMKHHIRHQYPFLALLGLGEAVARESVIESALGSNLLSDDWDRRLRDLEEVVSIISSLTLSFAGVLARKSAYQVGRSIYCMSIVLQNDWRSSGTLRIAMCP